MRGFGTFEAAARFCTAHDELRDYFRFRKTTGEIVSLAEQRRLFRDRWVALLRLIAV
jgi:putative transposase